MAAILAAIFARRAAVLRQQLVVMEQLNDTAADVQPEKKTLVFTTNSEDQSATAPPMSADQSAAFANPAYEDTGYMDMDELDELRAQL